MMRLHRKIHAFGSALVVIVIAVMLFAWYLTLATKNEWPSGQQGESHAVP